jgi:hypothetical protein
VLTDSRLRWRTPAIDSEPDREFAGRHWAARHHENPHRQYARNSNGSRPGIRITIGDTGCGIPPEIRETLFEPFVTGKGETATGLGLWLSSEIVHKHGGTIQVKSRAQPPFTGTVFSIFLPEHHDWLFGHSSRRAPDSGAVSARLAINDSLVLQGAGGTRSRKVRTSFSDTEDPTRLGTPEKLLLHWRA